MYFLREFLSFQYGRFEKIFMPPNDSPQFLTANIALFCWLLIQSYYGKKISRNGYGHFFILTGIVLFIGPPLLTLKS